MGRPKKNATTSSYVPKKIQGLFGMEDIAPEADPLWGLLFRRLSRLARIYGFEKTEPPLLEDFRLFEQFYKTDPKKLDTILKIQASEAQAALRPSFLPGILRQYYSNKIYDKSPLSKWSYLGPVVSSNSDGIQVSDYQYGFEVFGQFNHLTEAQVVGGVWEMIQQLGLKDSVLEINHLGKEDCQLSYSQTLQDFLQGKKYQLCDDCNNHMDSRVLNVFRCTNLDCQTLLSEAPAVLDFLDEEARKHFTNILEALDEMGVPYQLNPLYAGPAGHGKTNLVIKCKVKGETVILGEAGYHESLIQSLCGKSYSCFGFVGSLSVLKKALEDNKVVANREIKTDVFLVPLGELAAKRSLRLFKDLTSQQITVYDHFGNAGVKNQLKAAENGHAPIALIMGQKEAMDEMVILRDVKSGMQEVISYDKIVSEVKKRLGR
jgi:histidyl-tRNA synthetase